MNIKKATIYATDKIGQPIPNQTQADCIVIYKRPAKLNPVLATDITISLSEPANVKHLYIKTEQFSMILKRNICSKGEICNHLVLPKSTDIESIDLDKDMLIIQR